MGVHTHKEIETTESGGLLRHAVMNEQGNKQFRPDVIKILGLGDDKNAQPIFVDAAPTKPSPGDEFKCNVPFPQGSGNIAVRLLSGKVGGKDVDIQLVITDNKYKLTAKDIKKSELDDKEFIKRLLAIGFTPVSVITPLAPVAEKMKEPTKDELIAEANELAEKQSKSAMGVITNEKKPVINLSTSDEEEEEESSDEGEEDDVEEEDVNEAEEDPDSK